MLKWIYNKYLRHQDRKAIKHAFKLARGVYPNLTNEAQYLLRRALNDLLDEYHFNWGAEDGIVAFYYDRLNYLEKLKGVKI